MPHTFKTGIVTSALVLAVLAGCNGKGVMCDCAPAVFGLTVRSLGACDSARLGSLALLVHSDKSTDTVRAERDDTLCTWFFPVTARLSNRNVDLVESTRVLASYPVQSKLFESDGCCGDYVDSRVVIPGGVDTVEGLVVK